MNVGLNFDSGISSLSVNKDKFNTITWKYMTYSSMSRCTASSVVTSRSSIPTAPSMMTLTLDTRVDTIRSKKYVLINAIPPITWRDAHSVLSAITSNIKIADDRSVRYLHLSTPFCSTFYTCVISCTPVKTIVDKRGKLMQLKYTVRNFAIPISLIKYSAFQPTKYFSHATRVINLQRALRVTTRTSLGTRANECEMRVRLNVYKSAKYF